MFVLTFTTFERQLDEQQGERYGIKVTDSPTSDEQEMNTAAQWACGSLANLALAHPVIHAFLAMWRERIGGPNAQPRVVGLHIEGHDIGREIKADDLIEPSNVLGVFDGSQQFNSAIEVAGHQVG